MANFPVIDYGEYPMMRITRGNIPTEPVVDLRGKSLGGEYSVKEWIGSGSHADVFRATDTKGRAFAVKAESAFFPRSRLAREFEALQDLSNAGAAVPRPEKFIPSTFDGDGSSSAILYRAMIMEYVPSTLEQGLRDEALSLSVLDIARDAITAIASIHRLGYIHGGITERNLTDGGDKLVFLGFGRSIREPSFEKAPDEIGNEKHYMIEVSYRADFKALVFLLLSLAGIGVPKLPKDPLASQRAQFQRDVEGVDATALMNEIPAQLDQLKTLVNHAFQLHFGDMPNYELLGAIFKQGGAGLY